MDSLVLELRDELEVASFVVELVSVDVMDVVTGRDFPPFRFFPDEDVLEDASTADLDSSIAFWGDGSAHGFIVSQLHEGFQ